MCIVLACALYHSLAFALIFFPPKQTFRIRQKVQIDRLGSQTLSSRFSSVKQLSSHMSLGISRAVILSLWFRFRTSYVSLNNNKLPPLLLLPDGIKLTAGHHGDIWTRQIVSRRDGWCGIDRPRSVWHSTVPIQICQSCCNWFAFLRVGSTIALSTLYDLLWLNRK